MKFKWDGYIDRVQETEAAKNNGYGKSKRQRGKQNLVVGSS